MTKRKKWRLGDKGKCGEKKYCGLESGLLCQSSEVRLKKHIVSNMSTI